jgi:hypothetical protein
MKSFNKGRDLLLLCFSVIFCIFTIATTSIGIECYNKNKSYKTEKEGDIRVSNLIGESNAHIVSFGINPAFDNFSFLVCNLICAIFNILSLFFMIYGRLKIP